MAAEEAIILWPLKWQKINANTDACMGEPQQVQTSKSLLATFRLIHRADERQQHLTLVFFLFFFTSSDTFKSRLHKFMELEFNIYQAADVVKKQTATTLVIMPLPIIFLLS